MDDRAPAEHWTARRAIGRAIRRARLRRGLSQVELGGRSRLSQSAISRVETGDVKGLRYQTLVRLLDALDVGDVELVLIHHDWFEAAWPTRPSSSGRMHPDMTTKVMARSVATHDEM